MASSLARFRNGLVLIDNVSTMSINVMRELDFASHRAKHKLMFWMALQTLIIILERNNCHIYKPATCYAGARVH